MFRRDIEGLRAVAVGLVVLGHAGFPYLDGGFVGVDVFFVISGFLITSLLLREMETTGRISVAGFYARRATRLLPLAATVTVATLAASWLWLPPTRLGSISADAIASSLYFVNYRLAFEGTQYLNADEAPSPFQHFWSLAVEEQFYLVWPLLLLAVALLLRRRPALVRDALTAVLITITAATFTVSAVATVRDPVWSYFGLHTRGWELAVGALVAVFAAQCARLPRLVAAPLMWAGLAAIVWSGLAFSEATVFPGTAAAVPVLGTAAVIAGGTAGPVLGSGGLLGLPPFQTLGRYSYGLYLWHWPVLMIGPTALGADPSVRLNLVLVAAALGLTAVTHEAVENPVRFARFFKHRAWRGVGLGASLTAVSAAAAFGAGTFAVRPVTGDGPPVEAGPVDTIAELTEVVRASIAYDGTPSNLTPDPVTAKEDLHEIYRNGCNETTKGLDVPGCVYGTEGDGTRVALFGDSHAASWFPALEAIAVERDWELTLYTKSACPAPMVEKTSDQLAGCDEFREEVLTRIAEQRPDLVVVATSESNTPDVPEGGDPAAVWVDGWRQTLERLQASGAAVVLPSNPPNFPEPVPDCVAAHLSDPSICGGAADALILNRDRERQVLQLATGMGVHVIDAEDWFCADGFCPAVIGNVLAFRDGHHFTSAYAEFIAPVLGTELALLI